MISLYQGENDVDFFGRNLKVRNPALVSRL